MENSVGVPQKMKNSATIWSSIFTLEYLSEDNKNTNLNQTVHVFLIAHCLPLGRGRETVTLSENFRKSGAESFLQINMQ